MLNRKLSEIIARLTEAEKIRLRRFLASPYFNSGVQSDNLLRLYDRLFADGAGENQSDFSKAALSREFFPNQIFREKEKGPLDALASKLLRLVRRFLLQIQTERDQGEFDEHLAAARFYHKFALEERFWHTVKTLRDLQQRDPSRDARFFLRQFQLEDEEVSFRGLYNSFEDDLNLDAAHQNLDRYYSILKMNLMCAQEYQRQAAPINREAPTPLMQSVLEMSEKDGPLDIPVNRIYRQVLRLIQRPGADEVLEQLGALLERFQAEISPERFRDFQAYYREIWVQRNNRSGDEQSRRQIFELYREHLEAGYFYFEGQINYSAFRNLTVAALKLGEFDWVRTFLESHPPERICGTRYPAELLSLNWAEYYFYGKKYREASETLVYRLFENPVLSILADLLLIKIYYETEDDLLAARMRALDQKVRRSKLTPLVKNRYLNFLRKLDKIVKYALQTRSPKRRKLLDEIKTEPEIVAREWLLEQLGEK